jgi:hypothetical protein
MGVGDVGASGSRGARDNARAEGVGQLDIDLGLVDELTKRETAALDGKHVRSLAYREQARRRLPGGVSSSWQSWPPHPIYVDRGEGPTSGTSTATST